MATWTIATLESNTADGGVIVAHWRVTEEETVGENTYSASSYGTVGFTPDASAEGFIAYDSLDEATVLGWVQEQVDQDAIEASLTANIEEQKAPVTSTGTPW
jgi:hypothetical protein